MQVNDFIKELAAQIEGLDPGSLAETTKIEDIPGWDSLAVLNVMAMVDTNYGVIIEAGDLRRDRTIGQLFEAVEAKKA